MNIFLLLTLLMCPSRQYDGGDAGDSNGGPHASVEPTSLRRRQPSSPFAGGIVNSGVQLHRNCSTSFPSTPLYRLLSLSMRNIVQIAFDVEILQEGSCCSNA